MAERKIPRRMWVQPYSSGVWGLGCRNEQCIPWGQCCPHGMELLGVEYHLPHLLALKMLFLGAQSFLLEFRAAKVPHTPTAACGGTGNERVREGRPAETGGSCRQVRNFPTSRTKKMTAEKPKKKSPNDVLEKDPRATAERRQALGRPGEQTMTSQNPSCICIPCCPLGKVSASI